MQNRLMKRGQLKPSAVVRSTQILSDDWKSFEQISKTFQETDAAARQAQSEGLSKLGESSYADFLKEVEKICKKDEPLITLLSFKIIRGDQKLVRFEGNGTCVTLDLVNNQKNQRFLQKIDKLCIEYRVLPSIIKDSRLSKNIFDQCYTEAEEFREKLLKFDKNRVYQSEISHKFKL